MSVDVEAYLRRIGFHGPRQATLEVLHALCSAHVRTIPFENLDVLLQRPMSLQLAALEDKLVHRRRGGYCFEHHTLLHAVLTAMGFDARVLAARARVGASRDVTPPPTHACIAVELENATWLVDVGVGRASATAAIRVALGEEQATPHEPRRITRFGDDYMHQSKLGDRWEDIAQFSMRPMPVIDRQVAHWYTSTHPGSAFRHTLMVARSTPEGRITLRDRRLTTRHGSGLTQSRIEDATTLQSVLRASFGLMLGTVEVNALEQRLQAFERADDRLQHGGAH